MALVFRIRKNNDQVNLYCVLEQLRVENGCLEQNRIDRLYFCVHFAGSKKRRKQFPGKSQACKKCPFIPLKSAAISSFRFIKIVDTNAMVMNVVWAVIFLICSTVAFSEEGATCWEKAADRYGVSPEVLVAIAITESNLDARAVRINEGSHDVGIMQINSYWFPILAEQGIDESDLFNPCTNIHVGAWIYAQEVQRYGNTWVAIGAYHAGAYTDKTREKKLPRILEYAKKVHSNFARYYGLD